MHSPRRALAVILLLVLPFLACSGSEGDAANAILRRPGEIEISATVHARAFNRPWMMPGYHALVWEKGHAAMAALLRTDASDVQILDALEAIGARPGDNLTMETWEKRKNPKHPAPHHVIAGTPVEVLLRLPGRESLVPLAAVLEDPGRRGLEMRFGGNRRNIPEWESGCIVCLFSCPGSKVGNARYTVRDYVRKATRYRVRPGTLPAEGTRVGVVFRIPNPES